MDVAVSALRADLAGYIKRVREGDEVVVTDRGTPVARIVPVDEASLLEQLTQEGVLGRPRGPKPLATRATRVDARGSVSDLVSEDRR